MSYDEMFRKLQVKVAELYWDSCTVFRRVSSQNPANKATEITDVELPAFRCRLSVATLPTSNQLEPNTALQIVYKIFCDICEDITKGDKVKIKRKTGDTLWFVAGKPHKYRSHTEIILTEKEDA